jgi:hypothetical protein
MTLIRYPAIGIALLLASFGSALSAESFPTRIRRQPRRRS